MKKILLTVLCLGISLSLFAASTNLGLTDMNGRNSRKRNCDLQNANIVILDAAIMSKNVEDTFAADVNFSADIRLISGTTYGADTDVEFPMNQVYIVTRCDTTTGGCTVATIDTTGIADGTIVIIRGDSETQQVGFGDGIATGCQLAGGVGFRLGNGDILALVFDAADAIWYELFRSDN